MESALTYKGFSQDQLAQFGVEFQGDRIVVPYYTTKGAVWRRKVFQPGGAPAVFWEGESKAQVPYGLETVQLGGEIVFLTEGESCSWALRVAYPNIPVLGVPGAQAWKQDWAGIVKGFKRVYLLFDADKAGRQCRERVLEDLPDARDVVWPDGLDTRDVLQHEQMGRSFCSAAILEAEAALGRDIAVRDGDHVDTWLRRYLYLQAQGIAKLRRAGVIE